MQRRAEGDRYDILSSCIGLKSSQPPSPSLETGSPSSMSECIPSSSAKEEAVKKAEAERLDIQTILCKNGVWKEKECIKMLKSHVRVAGLIELEDVIPYCQPLLSLYENFISQRHATLFHSLLTEFNRAAYRQGEYDKGLEQAVHYSNLYASKLGQNHLCTIHIRAYQPIFLFFQKQYEMCIDSATNWLQEYEKIATKQNFLHVALFRVRRCLSSSLLFSGRLPEALDVALVNERFCFDKEVRMTYSLFHAGVCYYQMKDYSNAILKFKQAMKMMHWESNYHFPFLIENQDLLLKSIQKTMDIDKQGEIPKEEESTACLPSSLSSNVV